MEEELTNNNIWKTIFKEMEVRFFAELSTKTGWGKNEIKSLWDKIKTETLEKFIN